MFVGGLETETNVKINVIWNFIKSLRATPTVLVASIACNSSQLLETINTICNCKHGLIPVKASEASLGWRCFDLAAENEKPQWVPLWSACESCVQQGLS